MAGPAGSTMLAIAEARQLALQGNRVLLTCFDRNLSRWMRRTSNDALGTSELFEGDRPLLVVTRFHGLVRDFCERTGRLFHPAAGGPRVDDLARPRVDELLYVALSRARSHLIILGELPVDWSDI